jgi:hypothetical protein
MEAQSVPAGYVVLGGHSEFYLMDMSADGQIAIRGADMLHSISPCTSDLLDIFII